MFGYLRVASIFPHIKVGNIDFNAQNILKEINKLSEYNVKICVSPELSLTGVSLGDLFFDEDILNDSIKYLLFLVNETKNIDMLYTVGLPFKYKNSIYDVVAIIKSGQILSFIRRDNIKYSKVLSNRQFSDDCEEYAKIVLNDKINNVVYEFNLVNQIKILCENFDNLDINLVFDLDKNDYSGIVLNPNCQYESSFLYNISLKYKIFSEINNCVLITSSPSYKESTSNFIFNSKSYIYECGDLLMKNHNINSTYIMIDIDIDKIISSKLNNQNKSRFENIKEVVFSFENTDFFKEQNAYRIFNKTPYINKDINAYDFSMHIINMLSIALLKRIETTNVDNILLGLSGGLDSTFALLVCKNTISKITNKIVNLICVSMPCFGTSAISLENTKKLTNSLEVELKTIDISDTVNKHLLDINHDLNDYNITFENSQSRERTQVLMDLSNDLNGLVIGTSDLSEIALGFSTYNGDQMSMYNINGSIQKTLIRYILNAIADKNLETNKNIELANVLKSILSVPISPELLPDDNNQIGQKTENILGDYILHDFFIYNYLKYHYSIEKIYDLSLRTFIYDDENSNYTEEYIKKCLNLCFDRFYKYQYKRKSSPDSPSVGSVSLSSNNGFETVSDLEIIKKI